MVPSVGVLLLQGLVVSSKQGFHREGKSGKSQESNFNFFTVLKR